MMEPTKRKREKKIDPSQVSPASYDKKYPPTLNNGVRFGHGTREAGKLDTSQQPGPADYRIKGGFDDLGTKPKFVMGMRYGEKSMQDMPGPGDYDTSLNPNMSYGPAHWIGTGKRSDLGVGKALYTPGPGQYNL